MGIQDLNRFISEHAPSAIVPKTFADFHYQVISVDILVYLYKFMSDNKNYMEELYIFLSIFKKNHIRPLFIFDGPPPVEKHEVIKERSMQKKQNEREYHALKKTGNMTEKNDTLVQLKQKIKRLTPEMIAETKKFITAFGFSYFVAPSEADVICACLVKSGIANACLSEDMDMFLHECPVVLRNLNIYTQSIYEYKLDVILKELHISFMNFKYILILSGTDYYKSVNSYRLPKWMDIYNSMTDKDHFLEELAKQNMIHESVYIDIQMTHSMIMNMDDEFVKDDFMTMTESVFDITKIRHLLSFHNFVFVDLQ